MLVRLKVSVMYLPTATDRQGKVGQCRYVSVTGLPTLNHASEEAEVLFVGSRYILGALRLSQSKAARPIRGLRNGSSLHERIPYTLEYFRLAIACSLHYSLA